MRVIGYNKRADKRQISPHLPDFYADSIFDIDFAYLEKIGIKHIMLDLDQTLRQAYSRKLENEVITLFTKLKQNHSFKSVNIVSNNSRNLSRYSKPIGANLFQPYWHKRRFIRKPSKLFYERVLEVLDISPHTAVMIGDKIHNDVFGANRAGIHSILVKPFGRDYWFDQILFARLREKRSLSLALQTKSQHLRSTPDYIRQALNTIDIRATSVNAHNSNGTRPNAYLAESNGQRYFIKLIGNKKTISDWIRQFKDRIVKLGKYDATAYLNPQHAVELQSFISREALDAGVRTPTIVGTVDLGDFRYGVVQKYIDATPLHRSKSDTVSSTLLDSIWENINTMHEAAIAHRSLHIGNILVDQHNKPWVIHLDNAILAASQNSIDQDNAEFLVSLAIQFGIKSAVASAHRNLNSDSLKRLKQFLKLKYMSADTKHNLRRKPSLLTRVKQSL